MAAVGEGDDEKLKKILSPKEMLRSVTSGTASLMIGRYGNIYRPVSGLFLGAIYQLEKEQGGKGEMTQELNELLNMIQYTRPIKQYTNTFEAISYFLPAYAIGIDDAYGAVMAMSKMTMKLSEGKSFTDDEKLMWDNLTAINAAITYAYPNPFTPVLRDIAEKKARGSKKKKSTGRHVYR
ncbi:hypothetical protein MHBO_005053 [Bonamia ostreae]|uniref:Uncharacterized protein n=1 Tax=Bonamia ostreae TaxID=126728 RepID=A0ABV2AUZ6_9EUKA